MTTSAATAALLPVGDVFLGDLDGPTDADWIRAELTAGAGYLVTIAARDPDGDGPRRGARDTILEIYNEQQELIASMDDQALVNGVLPVGGFHPQLDFTPASGGVHYFRVSSFISPGKDNSGGYRLELEETRPALDPAPGAGAGPGGDPDSGAETSAPVAMVDDGAEASRLEVGGVHLGVLDGPADAAWITATLTGGTTYILAVASRDPDGGGPLSGAKDTKLEIYNGQDELVASMDDQALVNGVLPVGGMHPRLSFTPSADGDYFFRVSSFIFPGEDYSGGYQLELAEAPPPPPAPDPAPDADPDPDTGGPTDDGDGDGPGDDGQDWGEQLWRTMIGEPDPDPAYVLYGEPQTTHHFPLKAENIAGLVHFSFNEAAVMGGEQWASVRIDRVFLAYAGGKKEEDGYTFYGHDETATFSNSLYGYGWKWLTLVGGYGDDVLDVSGSWGRDGNGPRHYLFGDGLRVPPAGPVSSFGHGDDDLIGGGGTDYMYDGGGNDTLRGHSRDYLNGGPGNDTLTLTGHGDLIGGPGNDLFDVSYYTALLQGVAIRIWDFQDGVDRIKIGVATETNLQWEMDQIATATNDGVTLPVLQFQAPGYSDYIADLMIYGAEISELQFEVVGGDLFIV